MKSSAFGISLPIQTLARGTGVLYFIVMVGSIFMNFGVRNALTDASNAAATANHIIASLPLYRAGLAIELLMLLCNTVLALALYVLLKPVSKRLALLTAFLGLMAVAVASFNALLDYAPLELLTGGGAYAAIGTNSAQTLSLLFLNVHGDADSILLLFAGASDIIIGFLIFRSTFLPRFLGILLAIDGPCLLIQSFTTILAPPIENVIFPYILLPAFVANLALTLWLIIMGVNAQKWNQRY